MQDPLCRLALFLPRLVDGSPDIGSRLHYALHSTAELHRHLLYGDRRGELRLQQLFEDDSRGHRVQRCESSPLQHVNRPDALRPSLKVASRSARRSVPATGLHNYSLEAVGAVSTAYCCATYNCRPFVAPPVLPSR